MTGSSTALPAEPELGREPRPTPPGETRFWCSCDPDRQHPYYRAADLIEHAVQARASQPGHNGTAGS